VTHVKRQSVVIVKSLSSLVEQYHKGKSILDLAKQVNFPPYLLARYIVEAIADLGSKSRLTQALRTPLHLLVDPSILRSIYQQDSELTTLDSTEIMARLAHQVEKAMDADPLYGPVHDKSRHVVGIEYEVVLEHFLSTRQVPFETEAQLRSRGTSKTPDVLLTCPLGVPVKLKDGSVEWKVVCWIDSKALFGDVGTHRSSVLPQAETYVHRFGPGLILYWFGHAPLERLGDVQGDICVLGWNLPSRFMLPTGEIIGSDETHVH
jgi:CDAN1-interacting nuclease 1